MRTPRPAPLVIVALFAASLAGCGGSDDTMVDRAEPPTEPSTDSPTEPSTEPSTDSPTESSTEPPGESTNESSASFDPDDICSNLSPDAVAAILGVDVSEPTVGVGTCFYFLPDRGIFTVAVVPVDQVNEPTPESVCEGAAAFYSDVETSSVGGAPAFAGVDAGSVDDTLVVCPPGYQLYFGGSLGRDLLGELAAAFLS